MHYTVATGEWHVQNKSAFSASEKALMRQSGPVAIRKRSEILPGTAAVHLLVAIGEHGHPLEGEEPHAPPDNGGSCCIKTVPGELNPLFAFVVYDERTIIERLRWIPVQPGP